MNGEDLIITDKEILAGYLQDAAGVYPASLDAVVGLCRPSSEEELRTFLKYASTNKLPIAVAGGQTGVTGAKNATAGGLILSMEHMLHVQPRDGYLMQTKMTDQGDVTFALREDHEEAIFPAGVSLQTMDQLLATENLWYPPNPTEQSAQLGGSVATHGSGARNFAFGPTRKYITGLHVALMNGDMLSLHRGDVFARQGVLSFLTDAQKSSLLPVLTSVSVPTYSMPTVKNAAGLYAKQDMDLMDLFIGSEGILGTFTEIGIGVLSRRKIETGLLFFSSDEDALAFVEAARLQKVNPSAYKKNSLESNLGFLTLEYFDANALRLASAHHRVPENARAGVEIEYFSCDEATIETLMKLYDDHGAIDSWYGEQIIAFRHSIPATVNETVRRNGMKKLATDFAVSHENYSLMHAAYIGAAQNFQRFCQEQNPNDSSGDALHSALWGHIGNDQVHFNFIPRNEKEAAYAREVYVSLLQTAVALQGTVSGEHGVGKKQLEIDNVKKPLLWFMYGNKGIEEIRAVKSVFDPEFLLNRGNIVPYRWTVK